MSSRDIQAINEADKSNGTDMIMGNLSNGDGVQHKNSSSKGINDIPLKTPTPNIHQSLSGQWSNALKSPGRSNQEE